MKKKVYRDPVKKLFKNAVSAFVTLSNGKKFVADLTVMDTRTSFSDSLKKPRIFYGAGVVLNKIRIVRKNEKESS